MPPRRPRCDCRVWRALAHRRRVAAPERVPLPCRFNEQMAGVRSATFGDPAVIRRPVPRLVNARIETDIGGQLVRFVEALDLADRTPGMVMSASHSDRQAPLAMLRSTPFSASLRRSYCWTCCSIASRSSSAKTAPEARSAPCRRTDRQTDIAGSGWLRRWTYTAQTSARDSLSN